MRDTIFALSSGGLPSGVAIVRVSGPQSRVAVETMCSRIEFGGKIRLSKIVHPKSGNIIDQGLVLTFVAPDSFTGEDVVEYQVHGGRAVVDGLLDGLASLEGLRLAEPGEFTYRAFENGRLDLTQAEGIGDLIASETEAQRKLAYENADGRSREIIEKWSSRLLNMRALIEAEIDFVDEEDIPGSVSAHVWADVEILIQELDAYLSSVSAGEIIRNGYRVTLLGRPNAGKSTLLNCLAGRELAIVTTEPGTTRDVIEARLNLGGQLVIVSDTAGIHPTSNKVEKEGIRRALDASRASDMTIWLHAGDDPDGIADQAEDAQLTVLSKIDLSKSGNTLGMACDLSISAQTHDGIEQLMALVGDKARQATSGSESALFSRGRQREGLQRARDALSEAHRQTSQPLEIRAEYLRTASDALGRIVGRVDVEDILGAIFSQFCVGK